MTLIRCDGLLALAVVYDGGSRSDGARTGGVGLQTFRDWVLRFNATGPEGLVNGKAPGHTPRLEQEQRRELGAVGRGRSDPGGPWCGSLATERSGAVSPGAHAIILLDQAGWHTSTKLKVPANISLLPCHPSLQS